MAIPIQTSAFKPFPTYESEADKAQVNTDKQAESRIDTNNAWGSFLDVKESNITRLDTAPEPPKPDDSEKIAEAKRRLEELLTKPIIESNITEIVIENKNVYLKSFDNTAEKKIIPDTKESGNIFGSVIEVATDIKNHIDFKMLWKETKEFFVDFFDLIKVDFLGLGEKQKPKDEKAQKAEDEKKAKEAKNNNVIRKFYDALLKPVSSMDRKMRSQQQIEDLNRKLGINSAYEGVMNPDGTIRADVETYLAMENSKKTEEQIRAQRNRQTAAASGSGKGKGPSVIFDLNKSAESHNSVTQLKG